MRTSSQQSKRDRLLYHQNDLVAVIDLKDIEYQFSLYRLEEAVMGNDVATDKKIDVIRLIRDKDDANMYTQSSS